MDTFNLKPMLAGKFDEAKVETQLPVCVQQKIDGIRCLIVDGKALSRSLKPIPNRYVQDWVSMNSKWLAGLDGELIVGRPTDPDVYRKTNSAVMSRDGEPDFTYYVFDIWSSQETYFERLINLGDLIERLSVASQYHTAPNRRLKFLESHLCETMEEISTWEQKWLAEGHEGLMIRGVNTFYKFGRATATQGQLIKVKRFTDAEAVVYGFEELMHNANEATLDNLGHTVHSSHKAGKMPMNTLGALLCTMELPDTHDGRTWDFKIGTGFDEAARQEIWDHSSDYLASVVKFKYFGGGIKDAPRFPVFLGWRSKRDM